MSQQHSSDGEVTSGNVEDGSSIEGMSATLSLDASDSIDEMKRLNEAIVETNESLRETIRLLKEVEDGE